MAITVKPNVPKIVKANRAAGKTVKVATSNLFVLDSPADSSDLMADAILEDIGGQEIINISRNDLLNGQNVTYNVIANLSDLNQQFNPIELIKLQGTDAEYFGSFPLQTETYVPQYGTGIKIDGTATGEIVYIDPDTGNLVINTINVTGGLVVEMEFLAYSNVVSTEI